MDRTKYSKLFVDFHSIGQVISDLSEVDPETEKLVINKETNSYGLLPNFQNLTDLFVLGAINHERFNWIIKIQSLKYLHLDQLNTTEITSLKKLAELEYLRIRSATKLSDISIIRQLKHLKGFVVENIPHLHDLKVVENLSQLEEFGIEGSLWTTQRVDTLLPLTSLPNLKALFITNLKPDDNSLKPIAELKDLKHLECANFFSTEDFKYLKKTLPNLECTWFEPVRILKGVTCKKCGSDKAMLTGKKKRYCVKCDKAFIDNFVEEFNDL